MSGHSKWSTIKHKKAINDAKKGKIFSKLSVLITLAARQGGGDPTMNPNLRLLLDEAKTEGFSSDNVKKAIDKGVGNAAGDQYESASYEGFGPFGIQIIVDVLSSNTNRVVADLRNLFNELGGRLGDSGAVSWNFDVYGWVNIRPGKMVKSAKFGQEDQYVSEDKESVILDVMDISGVIDIKDGDEDTLDIYTEFKDLGHVRDSIIQKGYVVKKAQISKIPKITKKLTQEELDRAVEFLDKVEEYEDVQDIWTDMVG